MPFTGHPLESQCKVWLNFESWNKAMFRQYRTNFRLVRKFVHLGVSGQIFQPVENSSSGIWKKPNFCYSFCPGKFWPVKMQLDDSQAVLWSLSGQKGPSSLSAFLKKCLFFQFYLMAILKFLLLWWCGNDKAILGWHDSLLYIKSYC